MIRWRDCLKKGLILADPLAIDEYEMTQIASYNSAFHSARAVVFAGGYTERSHACLAVALSGLCRIGVGVPARILT